MTYTVRKIFPYEAAEMQAVKALLASEQLSLDMNLDVVYGLFDPDGMLFATGSAYKNTLRCIAVTRSMQGQGLLPLLISELIADRNNCGFFDLFVYTKTESSRFFETLGFYPIASVDGRLVFMENKKNGFARYCEFLKKQSPASCGPAAAIVMNANPLTAGHAYLIEQAASYGLLHLFIVSDDSSAVPFSVRKKLIEDHVAGDPRIILHTTGDYLISSATFPAYFLKDAEEVITVQAQLDALLFVRIAQTLGISCRFVGDEPFSFVTGTYNTVLHQVLEPNGISVRIIPRKEHNAVAISASHVRVLLQQERWDEVLPLLPPVTQAFFQSAEGLQLIEKLKKETDLVHY